MVSIQEEIASQPVVWRLAVEAARECAADLPAAGERVAMIGCGTSHYIGQSIATLRESRGLGETDAFTASEFPSSRDYSRVIAITRSGTTTEVIRALEETGVPSLALTAVADAPVARVAGETVALGFADEEAVVQTRFATAALAFCRTWLGFADDIDAAAIDVERGNGAPEGVTGFDHFVFLGVGDTVGLAREAALKLEEQAIAFLEPLVIGTPNLAPAMTRFALAERKHHYADLLIDGKKLDEARQALSGALELLAPLRQTEPLNPDYHRLNAHAEGLLGYACNLAGDKTAARQHYEAARQQWQTYATSHPEDDQAPRNAEWAAEQLKAMN